MIEIELNVMWRKIWSLAWLQLKWDGYYFVKV